MNFENFEMVWRAGGYLIQDNRIFKISSEVIDNSKFRINYYNPFNEDLVMAFCSVNEEDNNSIKEFLDEYGSLGLAVDREKEVIIDSILKGNRELLNAAAELLFLKDLSNTFEYIESLNRFKNEVKLFKFIKKTMKRVSSMNIDVIKDNIEKISDYANIEFDYDDALKEFDIRELTPIDAWQHLYKHIIATIINEKLSEDRIYPVIKPVFDIDNIETIYKTTWKCNNLLSAIYMQLHTSLYSDTKNFVFCARCGKPTYREKFCSDRCALNAAKAKERKGKRENYEKDIINFCAKNKNNAPEEILNHFLSLGYDKSVLNLKFIKNIIKN